MNGKGWLIYNKHDARQNESFIKWFIKEATLQDLTLTLLLREELTVGIINNKRTILYKNEPVTFPDFAVIRTVEPMLNLHLESLGISVYNSYAISAMCNDKAMTHYHMNKLSIPMVDTILLRKSGDNPVSPVTYPVVIKERTGRGGQQVYLAHNHRELKKHCATIPSDNLIVQSTENIQSGKDVRVFIVGNEIIGAVLRSNERDFRSNFKLGGSATWYPLNKTEIAMINKIIHHFTFGMVGIDFLLDSNGNFILNEIEDVVGSRTLSIVSDINILRKYVTYIKNGNS